MVAPAQVIQGLRPFTWRGLTVLIQSAPVDFAHAQAVRKYPYVDGEGHDWTGREAHKVKARMFFLESLDPGAFTKKWPVWRKALSDGSPGIMEHPILGKFRAVVDNGTISYAAETTAGVIVDCSFSEDTEVDKPNKFSDPKPAVKDVAKAAQVAANVYSIQWPSQRLDVSLFDAVNAFTSRLWDIQVTASGYANQLIGSVEQMIEAAENLTDPKAYPVYENLLHTWELLRDAANQASKDARAKGSKLTQSDTTIADFAASVGNTEDEIAQLNLQLLRSPIVPKGTAITYYTGK